MRAQNEDDVSISALCRIVIFFVFSRFMGDDTGASAIEYGLIMAAIGVAIIAAVFSVGSDLSNLFDVIASSISSTSVN
jgi:pilus assembly protein Flp/PilA